MSHTLTIRLTEEACWPGSRKCHNERALPVGRIIRQQLETQDGKRNPEIPAARGSDERPARSVRARASPVDESDCRHWFVVAFGNRGDSHHAWALDLARTITEPLLTCEAVLAEAAFHLGSSAYVLSLIQDEMLRVAFDLSRNLEQLRDLADGTRTANLTWPTCVWCA